MFIHMHTFLQATYLKWSNDVIITPRRSQQQEIGDNSEIGEVLRGSVNTGNGRVNQTFFSAQSFSIDCRSIITHH